MAEFTLTEDEYGLRLENVWESPELAYRGRLSRIVYRCQKSIRVNNPYIIYRFHRELKQVGQPAKITLYNFPHVRAEVQCRGTFLQSESLNGSQTMGCHCTFDRLYYNC